MIQFLKNVKANLEYWRDDFDAYRRAAGKQVPLRSEVLVRLNRLANPRGLPRGAWTECKVLYLAQEVSWEALVQKSIAGHPRYRYLPGIRVTEAYDRDPAEAEELLGEAQVIFVYPFYGYERLLQWLRLRRFVFLICWDDTFDFYREGRAGVSRHADCVLSQTPASVRRYLSIDVPWLFMAEGGAEDALPEKPSGEFVISYVGNLNGKRRGIIRSLERRLGESFVAYGPGSKRGPVSAERAAILQKEASVSIALADFCRGFGLTHLKCRHFEIPCSGGLMLAEYTPGLEKMFEPDQEILWYRSLGECVTKALWVRDHPEDAWKIRVAGHRRAVREHTWLARFESLLGELDAARNPVKPGLIDNNNLRS